MKNSGQFDFKTMLYSTKAIRIVCKIILFIKNRWKINPRLMTTHFNPYINYSLILAIVITNCIYVIVNH